MARNPWAWKANRRKKGGPYPHKPYLTPEEVRAVRLEHEAGESIMALHRKYKVGITQIKKCVTGEGYTWVTDPPKSNRPTRVIPKLTIHKMRAAWADFIHGGYSVEVLAEEFEVTVPTMNRWIQTMYEVYHGDKDIQDAV